MKTTASKTIQCAKCGGSGRLPWTSVDNGRCFRCAGSGCMVVGDVAVAASKPSRATVIERAARALRLLAADPMDGEGEIALFSALALADEDVIARASARYTAIGAGDADRFAHYLAAYRAGALTRFARAA